MGTKYVIEYDMNIDIRYSKFRDLEYGDIFTPHGGGLYLKTKELQAKGLVINSINLTYKGFYSFFDQDTDVRVVTQMKFIFKLD